LRKANEIAESQLYNYTFVSELASVEAINGMSVSAAVELPCDQTLSAAVVCASYQYSEGYCERLGGWLRWLDRHGVPLGAVDTGIFLAIRAGVRWDTPLCSHWLTRAALREEFPDAQISDRLYEYRPHRFSCAGSAAGLDLMLHIISERHGRDFAARVGSHLIFGDRPETESLQSPLVDFISRIQHLSLRKVLRMMELSRGPKLSIPAMASAAGLSHSQLDRLFQSHVRQTPARVYQISRLRKAQAIIRSTALPIETIAYECGFASRSQFSAAFKAEFGHTPRTVRGEYG
jgi:AraC family carnitine catabolism transcriptional activator